MKITITSLESNPVDSQKLKDCLNIWGQNNNYDIELKTYVSGEEYFKMRNTLHENSHIVFLDIKMKGINGIEVAKKLRSEGYGGFIIFLTATSEYVFHGYEVHALSYMLKPLKEDVLFFSLDEVAKPLLGIHICTKAIKKPYVFLTKISSIKPIGI